MPGKTRLEQIEKKQARKAAAMHHPGGKSKYARKRNSGRVFAFFPGVSLIPKEERWLKYQF